MQPLPRVLKVGVQRATTEAKWIEENLIKKDKKNFSLVYYDSAPLAVEDVVNGRIVAAAMDDAPAKDAVKKKPVRSRVLDSQDAAMRASGGL